MLTKAPISALYIATMYQHQGRSQHFRRQCHPTRDIYNGQRIRLMPGAGRCRKPCELDKGVAVEVLHTCRYVLRSWSVAFSRRKCSACLTATASCSCRSSTSQSALIALAMSLPGVRCLRADDRRSGEMPFPGLKLGPGLCGCALLFSLVTSLCEGKVSSACVMASMSAWNNILSLSPAQERLSHN